MMRSVSFVDRLELDFSGNHFSHALALGDVDSDGLNEVVIGNVDGILAVFKGDLSARTWRRATGLGTITCVGIGDILNTGKNALVCINAEGICHIFQVEPDSTPSHESAAGEQRRSSGSKIIKPLHRLPLQTINAKVMCIANIAPGGAHELFVGHTDRVVGMYRWCAEESNLQLVKKWSLSGQIGSLSVTMSHGGSPQLLVSQPGGTYIPLCYTSEGGTGSPHPHAKRNPKLSPPLPSLTQLPVVGQAQRRNPTSSTEIVGHIHTSVASSSQSDSTLSPREGGSRDFHSNVVALCTLDGSIRMLKDERKQSELQVDHSLFAIGKLDVTGSGEDEIVVCAWDGMTYIVDQRRNVVRYQFEENVSAFCAGYYGMSSGQNVPCLVYSTFSSKIYLYHNITLPSVSSSNLILTMQDMVGAPRMHVHCKPYRVHSFYGQKLPAEVKRRLESLDDEEKQTLYHNCLYGES